MSRTKDLLDLAIQIGISGCDDPEFHGIQIVEDYLLREIEENRREQGFPVRIREDVGYTDLEKSIWKSDRFREELNTERWQQAQDAKIAHLEEEYDMDRMPHYISKPVIKL